MTKIEIKRKGKSKELDVKNYDILLDGQPINPHNLMNITINAPAGGIPEVKLEYHHILDEVVVDT